MEGVFKSHDDIGDIMQKFSPPWWKRLLRGSIF
jgi:predicted transcriptional regulator